MSGFLQGFSSFSCQKHVGILIGHHDYTSDAVNKDLFQENWTIPLIVQSIVCVAWIEPGLSIS